MTPNAERFLAAYEPELWKDMMKAPADYGLALKVEMIPDAARTTAAKMVASMHAGNLVNISNAMRRAAKTLGIAPRVRDIHDYCNGV